MPLHPRTRKNAANIGILPKLEESKHFLILEPLNYIRFMNLVFNCRFVLTDSGGIQEETTYLGIPCITLRPNTERPVTIKFGTNRLCELDNLEQTVGGLLAEAVRRECHIPLWDGKTATRVVNSIKDFFKRLKKYMLKSCRSCLLILSEKKCSKPFMCFRAEPATEGGLLAS